MGLRHLIIDGDPIVYRSGFAAQQTEIEVIYMRQGHDMPSQMWFARTQDATPLQQYDEWLSQHQEPEFEVIDEFKRVKAEPVQNCLHIVDNTIRSIEDECECDSTVVLLSGPGNYRVELAKLKPYKGNRDPSHVPVHYNAIRHHLTKRYGAKVVHNREADDEVSIRGWEAFREGRDVVIATIDKDLDQVPGEHYDYMKKVRYYVDESQANRMLWRQILSGDQGDNVGGCWRMSPVAARKRVDEWFALDWTEEHMWEAVLNEYEHSLIKAKCPYTDFEAAALETAQLVYMQRKPGELWMPPGVPFGHTKGDMDD